MFPAKFSMLCIFLSFLFVFGLGGSPDVVDIKNIGMVEWLKRRAYDQNGLGSKPTRAVLLCAWERHFTAHSPA